MPIYSYTAISSIGEKVTGAENVENERELAQKLREQGLILTSMREGAKKKRAIFRFEMLAGFGGVSLTDKLMFTRNLQVMVSAGVPLPKTFEILEKQARGKKFQRVLGDIREKIVRGEELSEGIADHPEAFPDLFVNMINVGEESGTLQEVLGQLTIQLEQEHNLRSKVKGAMIYPGVIVSVMVGVGTLMMILVVPQLSSTFKDLGIELPPTTRAVIAISDFLVTRWYIAFPALFAFIFCFFAWLRTRMGKHAMSLAVLRMPVLSGIVRKVNAALMTRTLSSLIGSGVPIVRALEITATVVTNVKFRKSLEYAASKVKKGAKVSEALKPYENLYPLVVLQMLEVGEETGETDVVLRKLAEFFEEEVAQITKNLTAIIEPALMVFIGIAVGFFAISMIQPMYSMLGSIK